MTWARDEFEAIHPRKCVSREVLEFVVCGECGASMVHCPVLCAAGVFPLHCPVCLRLVERRPATGIQYPGRLMPWSRFELMREKILAALDTCDGSGLVYVSVNANDQSASFLLEAVLTTAR